MTEKKIQSEFTSENYDLEKIISQLRAAADELETNHGACVEVDIGGVWMQIDTDPDIGLVTVIGGG